MFTIPSPSCPACCSTARAAAAADVRWPVQTQNSEFKNLRKPSRVRFALPPSLMGLVASLSLASAENWPGWRGPRGDGTSLETDIPIHWSTTNNLAWTAEIPGDGHASPIVWGDRIFTVSARPEHQDRVLICFGRGTGKIRWERTVLESPLEKKHSLNSYASSTPATDGRQVYVAFLDRQEMVVAAYDFDGNPK